MSLDRVERFSSWRAARALAAAIHVETRGCAFDRDDQLRFSLRAAATSIMTSLAQGCEDRTRVGFDRWLKRALGSAARLFSLLCLAEDTGLLPAESARAARERVSDVARLIDLLRREVVRVQLAAPPARPLRVN